MNIIKIGESSNKIPECSGGSNFSVFWDPVSAVSQGLRYLS